MSVRKGDQKTSDFGVVDKSRLLTKYTHDRVKDTNIFPKAQRWLIAKSIWDGAVNSRACIVRANAIRVETREDANKRLLIEKEAIGWLEHLTSLIDVCNICGYISDDRAEYWGSLAADTLNATKGWLKSDRARYKNIE